jgi:clan AA aspartic protease (TIGR02281 family)
MPFIFQIGVKGMKITILCVLISMVFIAPSYGDMYKYVDEKGTVHFVDDISKIPEKYQPDAELRKTPQEISAPEMKATPSASPVPKASEPEGVEVNLLRRHELLLAEVLLNSRVRQYFIVDTGASFTLINWQTAKDLDLIVNESTPFIPIFTASQLILTPLVTLKSIRVGNAEVENVDVLIHNLPTNSAGLLGNSFLNKFRVTLDSINGKMTLLSMQGVASPDRPGGYGRDYWVGQFRFYNRNLAEFKSLKAKYENQGKRSELNRVNNAIRYFETQLSELERKASFAGVPRNWRD